MFLIKRVTDPRLAARICDSFGAPENGSFAYAATKGDEVARHGGVLHRAGRLRDPRRRGHRPAARRGACRRDGARRLYGADACGGPFGEARGGLSEELRLALTKLGYEAREPFPLEAFFAKKSCGCGRMSSTGAIDTQIPKRRGRPRRFFCRKRGKEPLIFYQKPQKTACYLGWKSVYFIVVTF